MDRIEAHILAQLTDITDKAKSSYLYSLEPEHMMEQEPNNDIDYTIAYTLLTKIKPYNELDNGFLNSDMNSDALDFGLEDNTDMPEFVNDNFDEYNRIYKLSSSLTELLETTYYKKYGIKFENLINRGYKESNNYYVTMPKATMENVCELFNGYLLGGKYHDTKAFNFLFSNLVNEL